MDLIESIVIILDQKTCLKCQKIFSSQDKIPLCADCRYMEANYQI